jgi:hypothetical protein
MGVPPPVSPPYRGYFLLFRGVNPSCEISGKIFAEKGVLIFIIMNLRETIKRILSEELGDTESNYEKQVRIFEKLLYSKSYEGVCGFRFIEDEDDDRVRSIMIKFSEVWYLSDNDSLYLNKKLRLIQETKKKVADIIGRYLNLDNIYVGSYLQECNSSLNEETTPKDDAFQRVLKKFIPDGSTHKYSYSLPYSDEGEVKVIMKYSPLSSSRLMKMVREDGTFYNGIQLNLQIDEVIWKSDFDKDWEQVRKTQDLPTRFWSEFEDEMSDKFRKSIGMGYVDVYYKYPDTIK